jgi:hypothetical protein
MVVFIFFILLLFSFLLRLALFLVPSQNTSVSFQVVVVGTAAAGTPSIMFVVFVFVVASSRRGSSSCTGDSAMRKLRWQLAPAVSGGDDDDRRALLWWSKPRRNKLFISLSLSLSPSLLLHLPRELPGRQLEAEAIPAALRMAVDICMFPQ